MQVKQLTPEDVKDVFVLTNLLSEEVRSCLFFYSAVYTKKK